MPKVSVIVLVYNVEKYIEKCAVSLMEQTLDDIEYIFIDDCSSDNSMEVLKDVVSRYQNRKPLVKTIYNEDNQGQAKNRTRGFREATGEFVICCDSDDWLNLDMYEKLYTKAKTENLDIVWCDFYFVRDNIKQYQEEKGTPNPNDSIKEILMGKRHGTTWSHLVRRDIIDFNMLLYPEANVVEDVVFLTEFYSFANKVGHLEEALYNYRINNDSTMNKSGEGMLLYRARAMSKNVDVIETFFKKTGLIDRYKHYIDYRKYFNKRWILPILRTASDCKLWMQIHPEINRSLFFNPLLTFSDKRNSLLVELRLYPLIKKLLGKQH